MSIKE